MTICGMTSIPSWGSTNKWTQVKWILHFRWSVNLTYRLRGLNLQVFLLWMQNRCFFMQYLLSLMTKLMTVSERLNEKCRSSNHTNQHFLRSKLKNFAVFYKIFLNSKESVILTYPKIQRKQRSITIATNFQSFSA